MSKPILTDRDIIHAYEDYAGVPEGHFDDLDTLDLSGGCAWRCFQPFMSGWQACLRKLEEDGIINGADLDTFEQNMKGAD